MEMEQRDTLERMAPEVTEGSSRRPRPATTSAPTAADREHIGAILLDVTALLKIEQAAADVRPMQVTHNT